jgi:hypothetical protein
MNLSRWLAVLGCLCLFAVVAQAQPTMCDFNPTNSKNTPFYDYPWSGSLIGVLPTKSQASGYFYRLELDGQGSTNNTIAFDQTNTNNITNVSVDFDFRMGRDSVTGGTGTPADGLSVVLLNTSITQNSQNGLTSAPGSPVTGDAGVAITEEAAADYSLGVGLDIYANAYTETTSNPINGGYLNASNNNIKITYNGIFNDLGTPSHGSGDLPNNHQLGVVYKYSLDVGSNGGGGYAMNFDKPDFDNSDWDHCKVIVDLVNQTASVIITPAASQNQPAFQIFNNFALQGIAPYPMRLEFGSRTGGATSNIDIANVLAVFTP